MTPRRELTGALCALAVVLLAACGATAEGGNTTTVATVATVPNVGALPAPLDTVAASTVPETTEETVVDTTTTTTPFGATGNRILMLGDSILASTSKRYSNDMCKALVPLGWTVRIEAEVSRPVDFGVDVMRDVGDEDWDAGLVFLGTNYGNDANHYLKQLNKIVVAFGDVPVVLVKVSEFRPEMREVNEVIEGLTEVYDNVSVVDWNAITEARPEILREDGIHPATVGRQVLAEAVAEHIGTAPEGSTGSCLDSSYTDDSEGTIDGRPRGSSSDTTTTAPTGTTSPSNATTTTVRGGTTTTTVKPNGATTTVPGTNPTTTTGNGGTGTTTATTSAPNTTTAPTAPPPPTSPTAPPAPSTTGP